MSIRSAYPVTTTGVGRKDYSINVQTAVEPIMRSHQFRQNSVLPSFYVWPVLPFPAVLTAWYSWGAIIYFMDLQGNIIDYAPADHAVVLHDISVTGTDQTALTVCGLQKYSYPDWTFIANVALTFGIGKAEIHLTKGHVCEAGIGYIVLFSQWPLFAPTFQVDLTVHGIEDTLAK